MKPVIELIRRTGGSDAPIELYACGKCGRLHSPSLYFSGEVAALSAALRAAERCCEPIKCDCGQLCEKGRTACRACILAREAAREKAQREAAVRYTVDTAPGNTPVVVNDDYYDNVHDLCDVLQSRDPTETAFPLYAWLCETETPQINVDRVLENFEESLELAEDTPMARVVTGLPELIEALDTWNKKQTGTIWRPQKTAYVEITADDVYSSEE